MGWLFADKPKPEQFIKSLEKRKKGAPTEVKKLIDKHIKRAKLKPDQITKIQKAADADFLHWMKGQRGKIERDADNAQQAKLWDAERQNYEAMMRWWRRNNPNG